MFKSVKPSVSPKVGFSRFESPKPLSDAGVGDANVRRRRRVNTRRCAISADPNCDQGIEVNYVYAMSVLRRGRTGSQNYRVCFSLKIEGEWPSQNELGKPIYRADNFSVHSHITLLFQQILARQQAVPSETASGFAVRDVSGDIIERLYRPGTQFGYVPAR